MCFTTKCACLLLFYTITLLQLLLVVVAVQVSFYSVEELQASVVSCSLLICNYCRRFYRNIRWFVCRVTLLMWDFVKTWRFLAELWKCVQEFTFSGQPLYRLWQNVMVTTAFFFSHGHATVTSHYIYWGKMKTCNNWLNSLLTCTLSPQ